MKNGNKNIDLLRHHASCLEELGGIYLAVIRLNGLGHDDDGGVTLLDRLSRGRHGPRHVARLECHDAQGDYRQPRHDADYAAETVFFFFSHDKSSFLSKPCVGVAPRRALPLPHGPNLQIYKFLIYKLKRSAARLLHSVAGHVLGQKEGAQGLVLGLGSEALLGLGTLGGVGHLGYRVVAGGLEQLTLGKHAGGDGLRREAQLRDVRLVGQAVDTEINVGVAAGFAMDSGHGILEFYSFTHNVNSFKWVNKFC